MTAQRYQAIFDWFRARPAALRALVEQRGDPWAGIDSAATGIEPLLAIMPQTLVS